MKNISQNLLNRLKNIKLIGFDFDGVFTDGKVYLNQDGIETVICSRRDSLGLNQIRKLGIKLAVISAETNPVVKRRCEKLKIPCLTGEEKLPTFKDLIRQEKLKINEVAYFGDDLNDLECMKYAGVAFTVADGAPACLREADYITKKRSGDHAVREVCDLILKAHKINHYL